MLGVRYRIMVLVILLAGLFSCTLPSQSSKETPASTIYTGWWIYGEGQHIFKDEATPSEWELSFPNEKIDDLVQLYLAVSEMEYFPLECEMYGTLKNDTLIVEDFEILHIQGCGE